MFRAYEPDQDRLAAVKLFCLELPPERVHQLVSAFESLIGANLMHPSIAAPLMAGMSGASAYLAQQFVAADSADIVLRNHGPAPAVDVLRVASDLAGALDFAAAAGVCHGALHPRDVLVGPTDTSLTGFGVASALDRVGVAPAARRPYAAPERSAGAPWDRRADIFSLAAVLYEMMSGKRITGHGVDAVDIDALPDLPGASRARLCAVFAQALAERPEDRYQTALSFADALAAELGRKPAAAIRLAPRRLAERVSRPHVMEQIPAEPMLPLVADGLEPPPIHEADPDLPLAAVDSSAPLHESAVEVSNVSKVGPEPASLSNRSDTPRGVWPLALAVGIGLAVGFAAGYGVASRDRVEQPLADGRAATTPGAPSPAVVPSAATNSPRIAEREGGLSPETAVGIGSSEAPPAAEATIAAPKPELQELQPPKRAVASTGRILVRSTPAGATVTIDGQAVGSTPVAKRELEPGAHVVRITHDGYVAEQRRVTLTGAQPAQSLTIDLAPERRNAPFLSAPSTFAHFSGRLLVDSRPAGADVFIDNRLVGTTPLMLGAVDAGEHAVRLERDGYHRWTSSVRVVSGEQNKVTASLDR